jgi:hypothetical protein
MRTLTIPIDDDGTECSQGYQVQYKLAAIPDWTDWLPNPTASPIIITGLEDDVAYNVRYRRLCCDGTISDYVQIDVTTTVTSPM